MCAAKDTCKGRSIPCLTCPDAEPWPSEHDTCTLAEWATGPLLLAVPVGFVIGVVYGALRYFGQVG